MDPVMPNFVCPALRTGLCLANEFSEFPTDQVQIGTKYAYTRKVRFRPLSNLMSRSLDENELLHAAT